MPKTRLNTDMRQKLKNHARTLVRCPEESAASVAAKKALTNVTDLLALTNFPEREMAVLLKYEVVRSTSELEVRRMGSRECLHISLSKQFYFPRNDRYDSCHYAIELPHEHPVWPLRDAHEKAVHAYKDAKNSKLRDYNALIDSCRNYEDVEEVWPEAALIKDSLGVRAPAALMTLSEDAVARIKADVAVRAAGPAVHVVEPE
jgi:hypothetical protein